MVSQRLKNILPLWIDARLLLLKTCMTFLSNWVASSFHLCFLYFQLVCKFYGSQGASRSTGSSCHVTTYLILSGPWQSSVSSSSARPPKSLASPPPLGQFCAPPTTTQNEQTMYKMKNCTKKCVGRPARVGPDLGAALCSTATGPAAAGVRTSEGSIVDSSTTEGCRTGPSWIPERDRTRPSSLYLRPSVTLTCRDHSLGKRKGWRTRLRLFVCKKKYYWHNGRIFM